MSSPWDTFRNCALGLAQAAQDLTACTLAAVPDRPAAAALAALAEFVSLVAAVVQGAAASHDYRDLDDLTDLMRGHLTGATPPGRRPLPTPSAN